MLKLLLKADEIHSRAELYEKIAQQLPLPEWFGGNLDALHDTLTCDILPKDEIEAEIDGMVTLRENFGGYADALCSMLNDIAVEDKRLTVVIK